MEVRVGLSACTFERERNRKRRPLDPNQLCYLEAAPLPIVFQPVGFNFARCQSTSIMLEPLELRSIVHLWKRRKFIAD